jgi:hypothetical protein
MYFPNISQGSETVADLSDSGGRWGFCPLPASPCRWFSTWPLWCMLLPWPLNRSHVIFENTFVRFPSLDQCHEGLQINTYVKLLPSNQNRMKTFKLKNKLHQAVGFVDEKWSSKAISGVRSSWFLVPAFLSVPGSNLVPVPRGMLQRWSPRNNGSILVRSFKNKTKFLQN